MAKNENKLKENRRSRIAREAKELREEARKRTATYILGGFGLVAGLAWNEAIRSLIDYFFPGDSNSIIAKFIYAMGTTLIVVVVGLYVTRILDKNKRE